MISIENISKSFETKLFAPKKNVINKVSFEIKKGSTTGFLGLNGAGKSTIIKLILGFIFPDEGRIIFSEEFGKTKKEIISKIGFLPERPFFYPHLTAREFLTYLGNLSDIQSISLEKNISILSERLLLREHLDKKINNYSKGMLQRLGLIGSLVHDPLVLILDEPLSGMDPIGRREIKDILLEQKEKNRTIFFSSHILSDVEEICDRIVVLDCGNLKFKGIKSELLPIKDAFIVKTWGKTILNNSVFIKNFEFKGGYTSMEVIDSKLQDLIFELTNNGEKIISINRKHSTMEEVIFGLS
jgi:ABC-2 type transport system ATP-binding protein